MSMKLRQSRKPGGGEPERRRDWVWAEAWGRRFSDALADRGLAKVDAARILGIQPQRIGEYVKGRRVPPADTLDEIVSKLDLDPAILFPHWFAQSKRIAGFRKRKAAREEAAAQAVAVAK
jgi:transcriptional regulator with XRE-family HTH domain